ncbi:hypothetical protein [Winogradskyella alexanderae]|uniref:DUF3108 domain-containing protein n=1 Tax=Winogradskyella alexanderae TaxID=2877123 RepID=A0ABS7XV94_9FLAO|nr:hypothetical protein [Winogradskyella alexanderae]MCA0133938.1 hypothetical protein [Winogradskyella alexanderae]
MKYFLLIFMLTLNLSKAFGQSSDRTYLWHGHHYGSTYSYQVSQITIHSDSTYTWKVWIMNIKKEWKTYKQYVPQISKGKITRNGKFYNLTEYRNGNKTDYDWKIKIMDRRLKFYYLNIKEKLKLGAKYKRIE